jgi:hypothetical protein
MKGMPTGAKKNARKLLKQKIKPGVDVLQEAQGLTEMNMNKREK